MASCHVERSGSVFAKLSEGERTVDRHCSGVRRSNTETKRRTTDARIAVVLEIDPGFHPGGKDKRASGYIQHSNTRTSPRTLVIVRSDYVSAQQRLHSIDERPRWYIPSGSFFTDALLGVVSMAITLEPYRSQRSNVRITAGTRRRSAPPNHGPVLSL